LAKFLFQNTCVSKHYTQNSDTSSGGQKNSWWGT